MKRSLGGCANGSMRWPEASRFGSLGLLARDGAKRIWNCKLRESQGQLSASPGISGDTRLTRRPFTLITSTSVLKDVRAPLLSAARYACSTRLGSALESRVGDLRGFIAAGFDMGGSRSSSSRSGMKLPSWTMKSWVRAQQGVQGVPAKYDQCQQVC